MVISPQGAAQILNDVLIDNVTAHDSHVSEGIFVSAGGAWIEKTDLPQPLGNNVTVQNSIAHDIDGDWNPDRGTDQRVAPTKCRL